MTMGLAGLGMRLGAAVMMAGLAASSCVGSAQWEADLNEARQLWADANIDNYTWTVEESCFCIDLPGQVEITVVNDVAIATSVPVDPDYPQTVEDLFQVIEDNLGVDDLQVQYHPDFGYPEQISIDVIAEAIDDERYYRASRFTP